MVVKNIYKRKDKQELDRTLYHILKSVKNEKGIPNFLNKLSINSKNNFLMNEKEAII